MANIFNLVEEYQHLMQEIESLDGELTKEIIEKLHINEVEVEQKIKAYYSIIKHKEAEELMYKDELERLSNRIKSNSNLVKRLKQTISAAVDIFGSILPKAKQKSLVFDTLKVNNKENNSVFIADDFEEVISKDEEYEQYYNHKIELTLTPRIYKILVKLLDNDIVYVGDGFTNSIEFLSKKESLIPIKDKIKEYYLNKTIEQDPIPGTAITHNITPIFK